MDKTKLNICHYMLTSSTQLQKRSFHVIERTRTSSKCQKMKNARAKRAKILFHCQICKFVEFLLLSSSWLVELPSLAPREELIVFAYQIWKPQFLSLVQFPFDNCHSPFSPTTFFEIGVYIYMVYVIESAVYGVIWVELFFLFSLVIYISSYLARPRRITVKYIYV